MRKVIRYIKRNQDGLATVEYAIVMIAAAGFAGLMVIILKSEPVRAALEGIVMKPLEIAGTN
ncbi:MAG: DUF4244 domain-containing protein [Bifidobacteriaceae bacterium]|jgi:Flp pilus assembly pilin Flp|nr:DUF4244 domain-containing protein [Bifidobacteriaceae bacterium]